MCESEILLKHVTEHKIQVQPRQNRVDELSTGIFFVVFHVVWYCNFWDFQSTFMPIVIDDREEVKLRFTLRLNGLARGRMIFMLRAILDSLKPEKPSEIDEKCYF